MTTDAAAPQYKNYVYAKKMKGREKKIDMIKCWGPLKRRGASEKA